MTWTEREHGWVAVPEDVVAALTRGGFAECKRELTTSRRDLQPAGGVWQGVNPITRSVASAIWVTQPAGRRTIVFIEIDGELVKIDHGRPHDPDDAHTDEGGES
jgi:hypothetical protein